MKTHGYDLRILIMKSDLEAALLENYQINKGILTDDERQAFIKYQDDSSDIFEYVRDILLQIDNKVESMILFEKIHTDISKMYPDDEKLNDSVLELGNIFISSIEQGNGNSINLFFQKARILK